eukprot:148167-Amphidinium_carterae.1
MLARSLAAKRDSTSVRDIDSNSEGYELRDVSCGCPTIHAYLSAGSRIFMSQELFSPTDAKFQEEAVTHKYAYDAK